MGKTVNYLKRQPKWARTHRLGPHLWHLNITVSEENNIYTIDAIVHIISNFQPEIIYFYFQSGKNSSLIFKIFLQQKVTFLERSSNRNFSCQRDDYCLAFAEFKIVYRMLPKLAHSDHMWFCWRNFLFLLKISTFTKNFHYWLKFFYQKCLF